MADLPFAHKLKFPCRQTKVSKHRQVLVPIDLYAIREFIRPYGSRNKYTSPHQGLKQYLAKSESPKVLCDAIWEETRNFTKYGKPNRGIKWLERGVYKKYIVPYERRWEFAPLSGEHVRMSPNVRCDPRGDESASQIASKRAADDEISNIMGSLVDVLHAEGSNNEHVKQLLDTIGETYDEYARVETKKRYIVMLGDTKAGKSFFLNSLLATSEQVPHLYNVHSSEKAYPNEHAAASPGGSPVTSNPNVAGDAVHVLTHLMMKETPLATDETHEVIYDKFVEAISTLRMNVVCTDIERTFECQQKHALWKLPGLGTNDDKPLFNGDGTLLLNNCPPELEKLYDTAIKSPDVFRKHVKHDMIREGNIKGEVGEFFLPSNDSHLAVTVFNTYIWGGSQYAFVVKYVSFRAVEKQLKAAYEQQECGDVAKAKRTYALQLVFSFQHGVVDDSDEDALQEFMEERDDYVSEHIDKMDPPKLTPPHKTTREYDGNFHVFQGQGKSVVDDRVYIKWKLQQVREHLYRLTCCISCPCMR